MNKRLLSQESEGHQHRLLGKRATNIWRAVGMAVPRLRNRGSHIAPADPDAEATCPDGGFASLSRPFLMTMHQEDRRVRAISRGLSPAQLNLCMAVVAVREQRSMDDPSRSINQPTLCCRGTPDK